MGCDSPNPPPSSSPPPSSPTLHVLSHIQEMLISFCHLPRKVIKISIQIMVVYGGMFPGYFECRPYDRVLTVLEGGSPRTLGVCFLHVESRTFCLKYVEVMPISEAGCISCITFGNSYIDQIQFGGNSIRFEF